MRLTIDFSDKEIRDVPSMIEAAMSALRNEGLNPYRAGLLTELEPRQSFGHIVLIFRATTVDDELVQGEAKTPDGRWGGDLILGRREWDNAFGEIAVGAEVTVVLERTIAIGGTWSGEAPDFSVEADS